MFTDSPAVELTVYTVSMDTTRASLLIRVRDPNDSVSWSEFHEIYSPILYHFARARGLNHSDAEEIRSSCYETILKHIKEFDYEKERGSFKSWLRRIVVNRVIDFRRKKMPEHLKSGELADLTDDAQTPEEAFDEQWKMSHLNFCLDKIKSLVPEKTFRAFEMLAAESTVDEVCKQLELNANQVYKAKSRILALVRDQMKLVYGD